VRNVNAIRVGVKFHDGGRISVTFPSATSGLTADNGCKSVSQYRKTNRPARPVCNQVCELTGRGLTAGGN